MCKAELPSRSATVARYAAAVLIIAALSGLQAPYQYGRGNHVFQLPTVHQLMAPELFPGDPLVESLRNYPSAAYPAIAWIASTFGMEVEALFFALWALIRITLVALMMLIAARLVNGFPGIIFVTLAAATSQWAIRPTPIGGENIMAALFTHTELAFVLQVAAVAAWLYRRPILAGALIGVAMHVNAMTTVHAAGFLLLLWLLGPDRRDLRHLRALAVALIIAAPYALTLHGAMTGSAGAAADTARFWELLRLRNAPHYFLNSLSVTVLPVLALVIWVIGRESSTPAVIRRMLLAGLIYVAAMYVIALFGVHLSSSKLVVLFHPLRGDKLLFLAFALAVPAFVWLKARELPPRSAGAALLAPIIAAFMLGYTPPAVALLTLPALLVLLSLARGRASVAGIDARIALIGAVAAGALLLQMLPDTTLYATTLLGATLAGAMIAARLRAEPVLLALVALIALGLMARGLGLPDDDPRWYRAGDDPSFVQTALWAAEHTPAEARFITPTWIEGWRSISRRGTLAEYRDLSAKHWEAGFEEGLWERLAAVNSAIYYGPDLARELRAGYLELEPADLIEAASRFDIDYVVMPAEWPYGQGLAPEFANEGYSVFHIATLREAVGEPETPHAREVTEDDG